MTITVLQTILVTLIPFAQIYARIVWLNGSLDHLWTMIPIFWFPPFSLVPALMMKFGKIDKGDSKSKPYDKYMWIPMLSRIFLGPLLGMIVNMMGGSSDSMIFYIINFLLQIFMIMIPNMIRFKKDCLSLSGNGVGKSMVDAVIAHGVGEIVPVLMSYLPFIGTAFSMLRGLPFIGGAIDGIMASLGFAVAYIFINMINGNDIKKYCATGFFGSGKSDYISFIIIIIITVALHLLRNVI